MPSRATTADRGFTLVEVMVALAIVALAVPALLFTLDQQIDGSSYLRDRSLAQVVAVNRLAELRLAARAGRRLSQGTVAGEEEMVGRQWFWRVANEDTEVPQFTRVTITVRDRQGDEVTPLYTLVAYLSGAVSLPAEGG